MSRLEFFERVKLAGDRDVALARAATGRAMDAIGAKAVRRTRFVTAVSEIARNAVVHGGGGEIDVMIEKDPPRVFIECRDNGPGIADLNLALSDGYTSGGGMGLGLGGARRLADTFEIVTAPGRGVIVKMSAAK